MRRSICLLPATLFLLPMLLSAQSPVFDPYPVFDNGPIRMSVSMRGQMGHVAPNGRYGMHWPAKGVSDDKTRGLCFSSTPVLTGRVRGELRVSTSYYRDNFVPGPIIGGKPAMDPTDPFFRAYTANWQMINEADYIEWPTGIGAPAQANGEPYFYGPSQMFWVMNDLDTTAMRQNNGCDPMGVEMRCLLYAPWPGDALDNSLYLQVTYINKGGDSIRDAYAGYFIDTDLRDPLNDLAASDSARGLVYVYQGTLQSEEEGMPAAFGVAMLQTPAVPSPGDSARWHAGWNAGSRNLPVTAAVVPFKWQTTPVSEARLGTDDTERWHTLMRGEGSGVQAIDPRTGDPARFWYSGDPVTGTGWLPADGIRVSDGRVFPQPPADQRLLISAGPFDLAPGDTQQVTYAFIAARGATPLAAVSDLRDRAEFLRAHFLRKPPAAAYRSANVRVPTSESTPGQVEVNARMAGIPANLRVEISSADGVVLADEALDRFSSQGEWVYRKTVTLPEAYRDGVNVSFVSEWEGEQVRIPGRVSLPVGGSVELEGIEILEEGDGSGRISPEDDAKWFPRVVNRSSHEYGLFAQSYFLPSRQWLRVPDLRSGQTMPSAMRPWLPEYGYATLWHDSLVTTGDSISYHYDLFDPARNAWWVRQNWIPVEPTSDEWYDALMTQVRGGSDERPGVRLLDLDALQDKWYVASISGDWSDRRLALHDSATGVPYFEDYGLDMFRGAAPVTDGFRVVRGTISAPGQGDQPVSKADLFIFNPRHVLLARSQKPAVDGVVSSPSPMPLTEWTSVRIDLAEATVLRAEVYNLIGQRVKVLRDESVTAGRHLLLWDGYWADGRPAESGMYLLRIVASGSEVTRKIVVIR
jgi:hypothetical protein